MQQNANSKNYQHPVLLIILSAISLLSEKATALSLPDLVEQQTQSIVGIGVLTPLNGNSAILQGTGFVIGDGKHIATNYHVISYELSSETVQHRVIFHGTGRHPPIYRVKVIATDKEHDLAILELQDSSVTLPTTLKSDSSKEYTRPGTSIAFTGFPIGSVLGVYPATHRGIVAAVTPDATPAFNTQKLNPKLIKRLANTFKVYQLDATAYPGNSGSPVYDTATGEVIGVVNKVFVQKSKENAITKPSGITYAIPVRYLKLLAVQNGIKW